MRIWFNIHVLLWDSSMISARLNLKGCLVFIFMLQIPVCVRPSERSHDVTWLSSTACMHAKSDPNSQPRCNPDTLHPWNWVNPERRGFLSNAPAGFITFALAGLRNADVGTERSEARRLPTCTSLEDTNSPTMRHKHENHDDLWP